MPALYIAGIKLAMWAKELFNLGGHKLLLITFRMDPSPTYAILFLKLNLKLLVLTQSDYLNKQVQCSTSSSSAGYRIIIFPLLKKLAKEACLKKSYAVPSFALRTPDFIACWILISCRTITFEHKLRHMTLNSKGCKRQGKDQWLFVFKASAAK